MYRRDAAIGYETYPIALEGSGQRSGLVSFNHAPFGAVLAGLSLHGFKSGGNALLDIWARGRLPSLLRIRERCPNSNGLSFCLAKRL